VQTGHAEHILSVGAGTAKEQADHHNFNFHKGFGM
jgi:hypothetical protein